MYGTPKARSVPLPDGVEQPAYDPLKLLDAQKQYSPQLSRWYAPRFFDVGTIGMLATADSYGRGLTSVARVPSQVNILNIPRFLVTFQNPWQMQPRQTKRIISSVIPLGR